MLATSRPCINDNLAELKIILTFAGQGRRIPICQLLAGRSGHNFSIPKSPFVLARSPSGPSSNNAVSKGACGL